jgi:hypothetical protein
MPSFIINSIGGLDKAQPYTDANTNMLEGVLHLVSHNIMAIVGN